MAELEPAPLDVEVESPDGNVMVKVAGELDGSNVDRLQAALDERLGDKPTTVSFEMSGLSFMDTSGLALLIRVKRTVDDVRIVNPSPQVRSVIDRTGLSQILVMVP